MSAPEYRHSLNLVELLVELEQLFARERQTERLICRYLADLADRMQEPAAMLCGYADVYHLARCQFGLSFRATRERVRVGRALRDLPLTEQALLSGELSYSRVREVTRVARPEDELSWLREARRLPIRALEQRVVEASARQTSGGEASARQTSVGEASARQTSVGEASARQAPRGEASARPIQAAAPDGLDPSGGRSARVPPPVGRDSWDRIQARSSSPERVELRMSISRDAWALLERAMQGSRRASEQSLSDAEALVAVARAALAQQAEVPADLGRTVVPTRDGPHGETHSGSLHGPRTSVAVPTRDGPHGETHSGSQVGGESACDARSTLSPQAAKLLAVMGHRGGWSAESLLRASGLSAPEVADAILGLELAGRVGRDWTGVYAPLG